jgi:hypothetical protein
MAKTTAPLLSFEGSGQIAKTLVYSSWKGRSYSRRYVVPANPQTAEQSLTRNTFRWLNDVWKFMPANAVAAWVMYGNSNRFTDRNGFIKINNGPLREETDLVNMTLSPSAGSGLIAANVTPTPAAGQITVALTAPSLPAGWTIVEAVAACIRDQDPQTEAFYTVTSGVDATPAYSIVLSGLTAADYLVGGWFKYLKANGDFAYGQSVQSVVTVT